MTNKAMTPNETLQVPTRPARRFIGETLNLESWNDVKPFYDELLHRPINNTDDLRQWLLDRSELESYLSENFAWRYINMTRDTANEELVNDLNFFIADIQPNMTEYGNDLDLKTVNSPYLSQLTDAGFDIMVRSMKKSIEIFREANIPLQTEIQTEERKYGAIAGAMTVNIDGRELTLPEASDRLQSPDRTERETAWRKISERRYRDHQTLDQLFDTLIDLRHRVALNAGFANFRDYSFAALGRFDYSPQDCFDFHESVASAVVPLLNNLAQARKAKLRVDTLRPWDAKVDVDGRPPLKPFGSGNELIEKTIVCFNKLDRELGDYLRIMRAMGHLDVESRKGKAPGGYNYPLEEIGVPFIFMNATTSLRDLVTMVHEGGHAVHSFLTREMPLKAFRNPPMEVAELASMSMELLSMDHWDVFFENPDDLRRAKRQHLESIIETLPWVATIDKFQHWVYENPPKSRSVHTDADRCDNWVRIYDQFADSITDWSGLAYYKEYGWQRQLHLYEVPFYYIEYGIAQLGALGVWRNYRRDPKAGLAGYKAALSLGYKAPIRDIYAAAGVSFNFSSAYIRELMAFVEEEINELKSF